MRKPLTTLALAAAVSLGAVIIPPSYLPLAYGAEKEQSPKIVIQGEVLSFPSPLRMLNDTYYAPAQNLLEKMGYAVSWNESEGTLAAAKLGSAIKLTPGTDVLLINRLVVRINKPTALLDGSVWLPVRSIAEALGAEVKWNSITQTIFIKPGFTSTLADILSVDTSLLSYEGDMLGGVRDGKGKLFVDGSLWYEGQFSNGKMEGFGRLYDKERLIYEGNFANSRTDGLGTLTLPNGDKYQGEFREGGQTGEGNLYSSGKLVYRGQWKNGVMEGVGDFYNSQGKKIYSGGVALNERSGFGAAFGADGKKVYDGQWSHGVREGFGQAYGPDDKVVYEGSWSHDKENGTGRNMRFGTIDWIITDNEKVIKTESRETTYMTEATYRDGVLISKGRELVYIGDKSKDGLPHGKGILAHTRVKNATQYGVVSNFANIYEGEFQQGKMTGYGKMYDDNGLLAYDGQLVNGLRDGKGQSFEKGLLVYDGDWIQNVEQGTGRKYTYESDAIDAKSTSRTTVSIQEGDFEKGKLTKAGRIMKYYGPLWNGRAHGTGYTVLLYDPNSEYNTSTLPLSDTFTGRLLHEGEYKDGYREGTGKLYDYKNRLTYDGEFKKGLREGTGKEYDEDTVYTGPFVNDQKNGVGKIALISDPTIRFEGEFKDNVKSGHGREYYTDGNLQFDGEYKAGKRDGYGQIYHSNGVIYYQGLFREGVPVDKNVGDLE